MFTCIYLPLPTLFKVHRCPFSCSSPHTNNFTRLTSFIPFYRRLPTFNLSFPQFTLGLLQFIPVQSLNYTNYRLTTHLITFALPNLLFTSASPRSSVHLSLPPFTLVHPPFTLRLHQFHPYINRLSSVYLSFPSSSSVYLSYPILSTVYPSFTYLVSWFIHRLPFVYRSFSRLSIAYPPFTLDSQDYPPFTPSYLSSPSPVFRSSQFSEVVSLDESQFQLSILILRLQGERLIEL